MCGIGAIYNKIGINMDSCKQMLLQLSHRGAHADGSGILVEIDWSLYQSTKKYKAVAQTFIDDEATINKLKLHFQNLDFKVQVRPVPIKDNIKNHPNIVQYVLSKDVEFSPYFLRNEIESKFNDLYVCSLDSKTIVYKALCAPKDLFEFYEDIQVIKTRYAIAHARFSTNTNPQWRLCQPLRYLAHNGEINTLNGNIRNMNTKMNYLKANNQFVPHLPFDKCSDSAAFDLVLDYYQHQTKWSFQELLLMMLPKAWEQLDVDSELKPMYHYFSTIMEGWEGPASLLSTNGTVICASVDKCGLRPSRVMFAKDGTIVLGSEFMQLDNLDFIHHGTITPGEMISIDITTGQFTEYPQIVESVLNKYPFAEWTADANELALAETPVESTTIDPQQPLFQFAYTEEELEMILKPMQTGKEALGSMGTDTAIACLSKEPRLLFDYFHQLFAQVSNPSIDPIRESIMTSLSCPLGVLTNLNPNNVNKWISINDPIVTPSQLSNLLDKYVQLNMINIINVNAYMPLSTYDIAAYINQVRDQLNQFHDFSFIMISDANIQDNVPIPILLLTSAIDAHLTAIGKRRNAIIVVNTAEARQVHHMACLLAYGADIICPWYCYKLLNSSDNYISALSSGLIKIFAKMGISTLKSYKGSQLMETIGFSSDVMSYFQSTVNRITGVDLQRIKQTYLQFHAMSSTAIGSHYYYKYNGESHINDPSSVAHLQKSVQLNDFNEYLKYAKSTNDIVNNTTIRGLFQYRNATSIPLDQVEPWTDIVKRFNTGAMSFGSISIESHTTLAKAMNQLNGRSNSGEGGEMEDRDNTNSRSKIRQVASGRFGVDSKYLSSADVIQIKVAQGAKPGQGGELPGTKVDVHIATTRKTTPGVGLISPTNQHDIYSIEDLQQLIYDLKCANPSALISVKLVSQRNIGTVCNGVVKGLADHIVISGFDGGTGAASWSSIKSCGMPFELGLLEAHQSLINNNLRHLVTLQVDGNIRSANDVVKSCLMGAEEWGFSTVPLIAIGCIMMRKCHLNTCPVGIATQDPILRNKFKGQPEHVINYFHFLAQEVRLIMASLGYRTINEMIGQLGSLEPAVDTKLDIKDIVPLLKDYSHTPYVPLSYLEDKHAFQHRFDLTNLELVQSAINGQSDVVIDMNVRNSDRTIGAYWSYLINKHNGPSKAIKVNLHGYAGQSFGAFLIKNITLIMDGPCNDYVGKGLSGGLIVVKRPQSAQQDETQTTLCGNVCLYGATSGQLYVNGKVGSRFGIRNSGVNAVVEGMGDHALEYMTGGIIVCLGDIGINYGSGMTGGKGYILQSVANTRGLSDMKQLSINDKIELRQLLKNHVQYTDSLLASEYLNKLELFVKLDPLDTKEAFIIGVDSGVDLSNTANPTSQSNAPVPNISNKRHDEGVVVDMEDVLGKSPKSLKSNLPFIAIPAKKDTKRPARQRVDKFEEITTRLPRVELKQQAKRCMDCGTPFCQSAHGCPIGNLIPEFNKLVAVDDYKQAYTVLSRTNNFPEFTGRACPAPCRDACVLNIISEPVSIKSIECGIIDRAFEEGWVETRPVVLRNNKMILIVGSGPCGLAAADLLNQQGYTVTVMEKSSLIGGLLQFGIPSMKMDKRIVKRRVDLLSKEGIIFKVNAEVTNVQPLLNHYDAIILATGALTPNTLPVPDGCNGFLYAMDYLEQSQMNDNALQIANNKHVVIIGAGDTATDCLATAYRQGAIHVTVLDINSLKIENTAIWPELANNTKMDYGHEEGVVVHGKDPRRYGRLLDTIELNENKEIIGASAWHVESTKLADGTRDVKKLKTKAEMIKCDLLIAAIGFKGTDYELLRETKVTMSDKNTINTVKEYKTVNDKIYAAGDCRKGQSLIVWAIREGREVARQVDVDLSGQSKIPLIGGFLK